MIKKRIKVLLRLLALVAGASASVPSAALGQTQLGQSLRFNVSGTFRTRYEHLWNQFQPAAPGENAALSLRTTVVAELGYEAVVAGIELADSRVYLADENVQLGTSHVNPIDVLQAYVTSDIPDLLVDGSILRMKLGRQTMDVGSRRFVARNRFRNTINARTGLDVEWTGPGQEAVRAFVTVPVQRRVSSIPDNKPQLDIERKEAMFWGVFLRSRPWSHSIRGELQLYGLHERDSEDYQTRNRNFVTPGFRLFRNSAAGLVDFEIESVIQAGTSRSSAVSADTIDLSHLAFFAHAALAYTFVSRWHHRLVLQYDYASGDKDPTDNRNGSFDTLFGARRFEFGPTGIYGAFARGNINSPGVRVEVTPQREVDGFLGYRSVWLAQARDGWTTTNIRDIGGASGTFLGHQIEGRARWRPNPGHITFEAGFAHLWVGGFPRNAPNGNPDQSNPTYIYTQLALQI
jgi:hypothetical protein